MEVNRLVAALTRFQDGVEATGDGDFFLRPAGYAGTYDITLFGRGNGDLFTTFRWTTPTDGQIPEPKARLAVLANHYGAVDSYGVELEVRNLAQTPGRTSATITVGASDGNALTFKAKRPAGDVSPKAPSTGTAPTTRVSLRQTWAIAPSPTGLSSYSTACATLPAPPGPTTRFPGMNGQSRSTSRPTFPLLHRNTTRT